nr:MAG TPA: hypothetical protein [Caudoviricetes sp.]
MVDSNQPKRTVNTSRALICVKHNGHTTTIYKSIDKVREG